MMNIREFYILGIPIETEIGLCYFLKVKEYPEYFMDLQVVALTKNHIISKYSSINKDGSLNELIDEFHRVELFEIVTGIPEISQSYKRLFNKLFQSDNSFDLVIEDTFLYYRNLVMEMNGLKEEIINPNPEIQKAIERSRRVKSHGSEPLEFSDIATSIVGYNGLTYDSINNFTLFQFYMTYYRIAQIKNYDTSTLFATVSSEKVNIDSWSKHINLFEDEKHSITKEEFDKKSNSLFGSK